MSRPEIHGLDSPFGDKDQQHRHQTMPSLSFNHVQYRPASTQWTLDRKEKTALMSPGYSFQVSPTVQDHYGGSSQADDGSSPVTLINNIPYPQLQLGPFSALNHPTHPSFTSSTSISRPTDIGYSYPNTPHLNITHTPFGDRDTYLNRPPSHPNPNNPQLNVESKPITMASEPRYTLWWGELEPWMDEEYAKQVCKILSWDPISIKVPRPPPDPVTGRQVNNPGYCFLCFASQSQAAAALNQIQSGNITMPNSSKPFVLNWAPAAPVSPPTPSSVASAHVAVKPQPQSVQSQQQFSKEYSIFVGDLAPEVSNSDLVAVFRNPVLGLRNDREPRFLRPFLSCKSAKIMLDPVTGVSRGYGFVRFTEEADQQRALIEMHGLYCLSRPMRISPATAKYKLPPIAGPSTELETSPSSDAIDISHTAHNRASLGIPPTKNVQAHSVSTPLASNQVAGSSLGKSSSSPSLLSLNSTQAHPSTLTPNASNDMSNPQNGSSYGGAVSRSPSGSNSITAAFADQMAQEQTSLSQRYIISEESWKHHAQARAILSNLIGPNGEQLSSSDPYNTTVFVGGLSPLISEDTLRTFFAPFGEIHYVKVPAGKNCGFVQFIRKPDAEMAIEKMQGFPIGGSRIRLSWGRSQYKAAQAAAQAAQTAALQGHMQHPKSAHGQPQQHGPQTQHLPVPSQIQPQASTPSISPEQALDLVQKLGLTRFLTNPEPPSHMNINVLPGSQSMNDHGDHLLHSTMDQLNPIDAQIMRSQSFHNFSPFSPELNVFSESYQKSESSEPMESLTHQSENIGSKSEDIQNKVDKSGNTSPVDSAYATQNGSAAHIVRSSGHQNMTRRIQRASPTRKTPLGHQEQADHGKQDNIQDLNGMLASLDLDNNRELWRPSCTSPESLQQGGEYH